MQVDFGRALAVIGGERTGVHCLVVTFPYSNMRYVVALPGRTPNACARVGDGVLPCGLAPRVMVFDNAAGAAHRVAWDRITIVDVFHGLLSATASRSGSAIPGAAGSCLLVDLDLLPA